MLPFDLSTYFCGARPGDLVGHHDPLLVALSVVIAALGSYTALDLASRMRPAERGLRRLWLLLGAAAMGGSIWSMHFVAMLAFSLPIPVAYDARLTLFSLVAAILVTAIGLSIVARAPRRARNIAGAGAFMGLGVSAMHYTGMEAMRIEAVLSYDPVLYAASVVIAVVAASAALWLIFNLEHGWPKLAASLVMAAAIAGMHYTGMAAVHYTPFFAWEGEAAVPSVPLLGMVVAVATFGLLIAGLVSAASDRRLTARMNDEVARSRQVLDTAMDAFVSIDAGGRITFWNAQAEKMFGWSHDQVLGRMFTEILTPPRYRDIRIDALKQLRDSGPRPVLNERTERPALHRDGHEFPIELTISTMWSDGVPVINAFLRDISGRKRHEADLVAARDEAQAANKAKSLFLATMSHELRTPLNAVLGFAEMIRDGTLGPQAASTYREYAGHIHDSGRHLLALINDILDISKADADRLKLVQGECDVGDAVAMAVSTVGAAAQAGGVALGVEAEAETPRLLADERRLRQILINLLSNAIKFTRPGGKVVVRVSRRPTGDLAITVEDTGIGMTEDDIRVALTPFGQVDNRLSRKFEGTGLGLSITQRLLELHQGGLEITSRPGIGTSVTARFPADRVLARRSQERAA